MEKKKILGEKRRELILRRLKQADGPITGTELADETSVSRQVIVQDISILKARNHSILATSQGYIYMQPLKDEKKIKKVIVCQHSKEETEEELLILVDHGVTIKDVVIEHPVYGDLTASLMISNRKEVANFIKKMGETKAAYLSELTDGIHLHTIEAEDEELLTEAAAALKNRGFLLKY